MGNDELNFTEEEARCWADDPRNQVQQGSTLVRPVVICLLLVIAVLITAWLASSPVVQQAGTQPTSTALPLVP